MIGGNFPLSKVGHSLFSSISQKGLSQCWAPTSYFVISQRFNSNRASICRINRFQYLRQYPTTVVNPDGSTFTIRYREPRQIIKLPIDINTLSVSERQKHLDRRRPKTKVNLEEDFDDVEFDSSKYLKLVKSKK